MPSHVTCSRLSANETAVCGAIAGSVARFVIAPLDVVKIRLQVQSQPYKLAYAAAGSGCSRFKSFTGGGGSSSLLPVRIAKENIFAAAKRIATEEGIRGFFKGNVSAEYLYLTYGGSQFFAYHHLNGVLNARKSIIPESVGSFISGMLAGSFATAVTYPFDLLRTRFALQGSSKVYPSLYSAVTDIYRVEGFYGFYRGLVPSVAQIMPYMGLMFWSYETFCATFEWMRDKELLDPDKKLAHNMISGSLAGIVSKTGVFPLDVVRKRLQAQGPHRTKYAVPGIPEYSSRVSVFSCMRTIVKTEGVLALYKGLFPGLLKAGPASAVNFAVFELSKDVFLRLKASGIVLSADASLVA